MLDALRRDLTRNGVLDLIGNADVEVVVVVRKLIVQVMASKWPGMMASMLPAMPAPEIC